LIAKITYLKDFQYGRGCSGIEACGVGWRGKLLCEAIHGV